MKKLHFFTALLFMCTAGPLMVSLHSQVTVGSDIEPRRAALLDLKARQGAAGTVSSVSDGDNVTAGLNDGGLLLPRVKLVSISTLEPFIPTGDSDYTANTDNLKERLAGLMVYNLTDNGVGSTLYPAVYTWNGVIWVTSRPNDPVSSVTGQPEAFTFYELGTETVAALDFIVSGPGTWTYQWYQITGSNIHIRLGTPVGQAGTIYTSTVTANAAGANTASFTPQAVIQGTTRNANYTGFYKFYCIATSTLGAELTSDIAEVAVGCGAKNNAGEWMSFMCFNLGASDLTIAAQMNHPLTFNPPNDANGRHYYIAGEEGLYGDLYQWGRIGDGHEKRGAAQGFIPGQNTPGTNQVAYNMATPPTYEDGNLIGPSQHYPWQQVARTNTTYYGKFIFTGMAQNNYNWAFNLPANNIDMLWRGGRFDANDPCAKIRDDGVTYESFYPPQDGIRGANTNWRTPFPDEWSSLYQGGTISGFAEGATANTWVWNNTNGGGFEVRPDGVTTTLFLPAVGYRDCGDGMGLFGQGAVGSYWSTGTFSINAYYLSFNAVSITPVHSNFRSYGIALRCIKN